MKLKTLLNKTKNLSLSKLSLIIIYTVLVIFGTLTVNLGNNSEFLNITLPTWLTALGTIGAVVAAVGQMVWYNYQKQQEEKVRSVNARIFIDSLLTDYKSKFSKYNDLKYVMNGKNVINEGNLSDLYTLFETYKRNYIRETCTDYINDLKFGIKNIGIQADNHTIKSISERFTAVNTIKTSIDAYHDIRRAGSGKCSTEEFVLLIRKEITKIDDALQILKEDLTDSDKN